MAEYTEARIKEIALETIDSRLRYFATGDRAFDSFSFAVRKWLQEELPQMGAYDAVCDYGKAVHNAGRVVIDSYIDSRDNHKLVEFVQGIVRDMQEADSREAETVKATVGEVQEAGGRTRSEYDLDLTPIANVSILVRCSWWPRGVENGGQEACQPDTLNVAINDNSALFGASIVVEESLGHGIFRIQNLPPIWLQDLATRGQLDRRINYNPRETRADASQIRFESRVQ